MTDTYPIAMDLRNAIPWESVTEAGGTPLLLVRHAETAWNRERRMLGRTDLPLNDLGREQADVLAAALAQTPLARVVSSPLSRAVQTATPVAATHGLPVDLDPDLTELDQGALDGQRSADLLEPYADFFLAWRADPGQTRVPGGETLGECQARGLAALSRIAAASEPGPPVLVVTHQMVLASVLCAVEGEPLRRYARYSQRNTTANLIGWRDGALYAVKLHLDAHLPPAPPPDRLAV